MNRKTTVGVIAVVLVLVAVLAIWYVVSMRTTSSDETAQTATTTSGTPTTGNTPGANTFHSIFTQSGNHECTYELVDATSRNSSVIYIADGKMRGEFRTTTGGKASANLMIYSGGFLYSWKEGATTGKKTSIKSLADLPAIIPQDITSGAIFGTSADNVSWNCHDWNKDAKLLTLPTYVTFS